MKNLSTLYLIIALFGVISTLQAQGVADPLGVRGLEQFTATGTRARSMGWTGIASGNDANSLFSNPARLARLSSYEFRAAGFSGSTMYSQKQEWMPDKVYATLSLMFENRLGGIIDTGQVKLQRAYDDIEPNWERENSDSGPASIVGAAPLEIAGLKATFAVGYNQVINVNQFYQNNNAMDPYVGSFRPEPYPRPALGETVKVQWFQYSRERKGFVYGITPGAAISLSDRFDIGISANVIQGSTDDIEKRNDRGRIRLATSSSGNYNVHFVDSVYYRHTVEGTSTYSGLLTTLGLSYRGGEYSFGIIVRPGGTITRQFEGTATKDTTGSITSKTVTSKDEMTYPFSFAIGGSFLISNRLLLAVDYTVSKFGSAEYAANGGTAIKPWLDGDMIRIGFEYQLIEEMKIRGGFREDTQIFSGEGAPIISDPIRGFGATAGAGLDFGMVMLDVAYEYAQLKYEDRWLSNVNYNERSSHSFAVEAGIKF